ncbi:hypothetical protein OH491_17505 [Termitidicoccus mucosus]|uniref:Uncharacterized protein n=1 Tax=Termitidicoccus mucosus TaxID=1184151 RepID=A0A178IJD4_9BACT|nr:hypothetical protein AW736_11095 [Opitutaceae bacterium TSB47]
MKNETQNAPHSPAVAVLCVRDDSIYKSMPECDCYDAARDARSYRGSLPVVAHPPCRLWGNLYKFARAENPDAERALGVWCAGRVQALGGVLEHPAGSKLWPAAGLPYPGERDEFGGWTLAMPQYWLGHLAEKATWFYIVGIGPRDLPPVDLVLGEPSHVVGNAHGKRRADPTYKPTITKSAREATPPRLARWLVDLARQCRKGGEA